MQINIPKISNQVYNQDILDILINKYAYIGPQWTVYQMEWINDFYQSFKDHDKFLIIIYLTKKTLDFYSRNFTKISYESFYSKDAFEIEKFNIIEIASQINIPKESARRKIIELEKSGVILRSKKKIIINRSAFLFIKPITSIKNMSRFLSILSKMLVNEKILSKPLSSAEIEKVIKDNFSYIWKIYYELQIPMIVNYKKLFGDIESFVIYGTCLVNQHYLNSKKINVANVNRNKFIRTTYSNNKMQGLNAMSISDITGIPRATVVRKLKVLVMQKKITIDNKKYYRITGAFVKKLKPLQSVVLKKLANFSTHIYNLAIL